MSLRAMAYSAVRWTAFAVICKLLMQLAQVVILARILSVPEMGLVAILLSFTTLILAFVDVGVNNVIMHSPRLSHAERSKLYWLNVLVGAGWTLLVMGVSPWIASFYGEPAFRDALLLIAPYFLIFAAGQQLKVVAEKELLFNRLIVIELVASVCCFVVTIGLAFVGYGAKAVAIGFTTMGLVFTVLAWVFLSSGWRPGIPPNLKGVGGHIRYGAYVVGNNILGGINSGVDIFLGGRVIGIASLGVYSLPRDLMMNASAVINAVAARVGLPVMAKAQSDPELLKNIYLKTIRITASINMPVFMAIFILAPEVVWLMFGERWKESVILLQILAVWGMLRSIMQPIGSLLFAVGRADLAMKWNFGLMCFMVPFIWFGLHHQHAAVGLSLTMVCIVLALQVPNWFYLVRPICGATAVEYFVQLSRPFIATILTMGAVHILLIPINGPMFRLSLGLVGGGVLYLLISMAINREWILSVRDAVSGTRT